MSASSHFWAESIFSCLIWVQILLISKLHGAGCETWQDLPTEPTSSWLRGQRKASKESHVLLRGTSAGCAAKGQGTSPVGNDWNQRGFLNWIYFYNNSWFFFSVHTYEYELSRLQNLFLSWNISIEYPYRTACCFGKGLAMLPMLAVNYSKSSCLSLLMLGLQRSHHWLHFLFPPDDHVWKTDPDILEEITWKCVSSAVHNAQCVLRVFVFVLFFSRQGFSV